MTTINLDVVLKRLIRGTVTLRKWTETERDSIGGTISRTPTDYTVRGSVYTNPLEYRYWASIGGIDVGEARGFFFDAYEQDTGEPPHGVAEPEDLIQVEEGDYIIDSNSVEWEILKANKHTEWGYTVVETLLKRRST